MRNAPGLSSKNFSSSSIWAFLQKFLLAITEVIRSMDFPKSYFGGSLRKFRPTSPPSISPGDFAMIPFADLVRNSLLISLLEILLGIPLGVPPGSPRLIVWRFLQDFLLEILSWSNFWETLLEFLLGISLGVSQKIIDVSKVKVLNPWTKNMHI